MSLAVDYRPAELNPVELHAVESIALQTIDQRIRAFLSGETDGEDVLCEIYDHVLDEPVPERLLSMVRR